MVRSIFAPGGDHTSLAAGRGTVIDMRVFALLCARLCHELSGPIGAANNGTESLADEDLDFAHEAVELISASVRQAAGRLQFYRFAYGFSGSGHTDAQVAAIAASIKEWGWTSRALVGEAWRPNRGPRQGAR